MGKPRQRRWDCPHGCGGVLAPSRMRRDDVRRYCLACSARTGRLVERVSPSVVRERERKAESAAARRKRKAEAEREADRRRWTVHTVDATGRGIDVHVREELCRIARRCGARQPSYVSFKRRGWPEASGTAWGFGEVHICAGHGVSWERLQYVLLHELIHYWGIGHHRQGFRDHLAKMAPRAWPGIGRCPAKVGLGTQRTKIITKLRERTKRLAGEENT